MAFFLIYLLVFLTNGHKFSNRELLAESWPVFLASRERVVNSIQKWLSRFPGSSRDRRNETLNSFRIERDRAFLFGAFVCGHEQLCDFQAVVTAHFRLFAVQETIDEVSILGLVTVLVCFAGDDGHQSLLGVLLFDQVFAGRALDAAAQEGLQAGVERVDRERGFGAVHLRGQSRARADEAP